jgi:hypothetical protein
LKVVQQTPINAAIDQGEKKDWDVDEQQYQQQQQYYHREVVEQHRMTLPYGNDEENKEDISAHGGEEMKMVKKNEVGGSSVSAAVTRSFRWFKI